MTVQYSDKSFLFLLLKWKGSVWMNILPSYIVFLMAYYAINLSYRFAMDPDQQAYFEKLVIFFKNGNGFIPIQFMLGFYISAVVSRWWQQIYTVAWPDKALINIVANIQGDDTESLLIRRTFARYCNLLNVLVWKEVSLATKRRFPTDLHVYKAGLFTDAEYSRYLETTNDEGRWFLPVSWMINLLQRCKESGRLSEYGFQKLVDEIWNFRSASGMMTMFDWISIPLAYNQVVTVATYGYFVLSLIGRQSLRTGSPLAGDIEWYFPFFTTLEFIFYVGWLKVGEELRVPYGEDDEDINMTYILDRNMHVSFMLVDELSSQGFEPEQDKWWNDPHPKLTHTKGSIKIANRYPMPHWRLADVKIKESEQEIVDPNQEQKHKSVHFATKVSQVPKLPSLTPNQTLKVETVSTEDKTPFSVEEDTDADQEAIKTENGMLRHSGMLF